jgi:hypothetical protein
VTGSRSGTPPLHGFTGFRNIFSAFIVNGFRSSSFMSWCLYPPRPDFLVCPRVYHDNMSAPFVQATTPDGTGVLTVAPYVQPNGQPAVAIIIKKDVHGVVDALLDGQPAIAVIISEDQGSNGPWVLGDLLIQNWEKAKEMAGKK